MSGTKLILLGTGTPGLERGKAQTSLAIVVDDKPYFIDCGSGVLQRAREAGFLWDDMQTMFITHLHPDHTLGLADFMIAPWVRGRKGGVSIYGPKGTDRMAQGLLDVYTIGIEQHRVGGPLVLETLKADVTEYSEGIIYKDAHISIEAFAVDHAKLEVYGLVVQTADKRIVLSADTCYLPLVAEKAKGCDILVHECFNAKGVANMPPKFKDYFYEVHTSAVQVGKIAAQAKPKLLVLNHQMEFNDVTPNDFIQEVREGGYTGDVVYGRDLDVFS